MSKNRDLANYGTAALEDAEVSATAGSVVKRDASGNVNAVDVIATGNVGVGTSSPDANLTVSGVASFAAGTALLPSVARAGDLNTGIFFPESDTVAVTAGGVEVARANDGRFGVGTTDLRQMFSIGGGGIRQTWMEIAVDTPTEIARATGLANNANRGAVYKVNVVATFAGSTTMIKEYIWMVQILQTTGSRTFTEIYSYENDLSPAVRDLAFTVAASKVGDDEILTITLTSSGSIAPAAADVSVYIEAYGGRDGLTQILA
jgi:hypothetical protein